MDSILEQSNKMILFLLLIALMMVNFKNVNFPSKYLFSNHTQLYSCHNIKWIYIGWYDIYQVIFYAEKMSQKAFHLVLQRIR